MDETCWTLIHQAAGGDTRARSRFARTYLDVVRAYLRARWGSGVFGMRIEDAVQDVFLECFRPEGALTGVAAVNGSFRTYLYAVTRNVARRFETNQQRGREAEFGSARDWREVPANDESLWKVFDRQWASAMVQRAGLRHARMAEKSGEEGRRRRELLRLRFEDGVPIRDIAQQWDQPAELLHAEYRKARQEFKRALREEVRFHDPGVDRSLDQECLRLLALIRGE